MEFFARLFWRSKAQPQHQPQDQTSVVQQDALIEENDGLKAVYEPSNPIVDIVFVHGLSGHREQSWTFRKDASTPEDAIFWPGKLLPESFPDARILTYGYDSHVTSSRYFVQRTLYSHSQNLLVNLKSARPGSVGESRPLIFISHSLGGIVVKSALLYANRPGSEFQETKQATAGLLFLGTPHQRSEEATWGQIVRNIAMLTLKNGKILEALKHDSEWLQLQLELYKTISTDFETYAFYEMESLRWNSGQYNPLVPQSSAVPSELYSAGISERSFPVQADHNSMCKFSSSNDTTYKKLVAALHQILKSKEDVLRRQSSERERLTALAIKDNFVVEPQIPFAKVEAFIGRVEELQLLHEKTARNRTRISLHGLGGIGKTQLAIEYGHKYHSSFTSIFWINAETRTSFLDSYEMIAQQLLEHYALLPDAEVPAKRQASQYLGLSSLVNQGGDLQSSQDSPALVFEAVWDWLGRVGNDQWLLILDNADDERVLEEFFPHSLSSPRSGHIIVTSRKHIRMDQDLELNCLPEEDSIRLLTMSSQARYLDPVGMYSGKPFFEWSDAEYHEAKRIVNLLDHIPLAIAQAGAYISTLRISFRKYLEISLDVSTSEVICRYPMDGDSTTEVEAENTVFTTWELSFNALREENPDTARLLTLCSCMSIDDIPSDLLVYGCVSEYGSVKLTESKIEDMLMHLASFSFIRKNVKTESYSMHPLVHTWAQQRLRARSPTYKETVMQTCHLIVQALKSERMGGSPEPYSTRWKLEQKILPHIIACLQWKEILWAESVEWGVLGDVCRRHGRYDAAKQFYDSGSASNAQQITMLKRDLTMAEEAWGPNHHTGLLTYLAGIYQDNGQHACAEIYLKRAMEARQRSFGEKHIRTLIIAENLGLVLQQQGKYDQALSIFERLLENTKRTFGQSHYRTLSVLGNLASLHALTGQFKEAKARYQLLLTGLEGTRGPVHPDTEKARKNMFLIQRMDEMDPEKARPVVGTTADGDGKVGDRHFEEVEDSYCGEVGERVQLEGALEGAQQGAGPSQNLLLFDKLSVGRLENPWT